MAKMTPEEREWRRAHYVQGQRALARRIVERQATQITPAERESFVKERLAYYERVAAVPAGSFSA
jgi:hypothetical protein